jgi:TolB-like protein/Tfp pilus assembly protein PilF
MKLLQELKRRNVFKVGIAYAVTIWILLQLTEVVSSILELPEWAPKLILLILVVGFVPALILAWAFELTPEGVRLEKDIVAEKSITKKTGRKLDYAIFVLLGLSLAYFIWESRFEQKTAEYEANPPQILVTGAAEPEPVIPEVIEEPVEIDKNSIAVLPFTNRSAEDSDVYFTDGIHDDLLTQLSKIDAFSVISRTSVMEYRDTTRNLRDIARELSVANVMEGSVQRAGDRVRINVQLIDADSDEHLWAEIYDRELTTNNLFDIQSEIAQNIADALKATLTASEIETVGSVPTQNVDAYDLYLQARRFALGETKTGYQTARELFKEALKLDPEFKQAWIGLARAHITNYWVYGGDPADLELSRDAIDRARAVDPDFPELYMAEGFYWYWGHLDYERALYNINKTIEQMPGNDEAYMWYGWASRRAGLWDQAVTSMQQSLRLNPRVGFNWVEFANTLNYLHRHAEAREAYLKARTIDPDDFWAKSGLADLELIDSGNVQSAIQLTTGAQHADEIGFVESFISARLAAGRYEEALEVARLLPDEMEIQINMVRFREDRAAEILFLADRIDEARTAADAAWFRLQNLRTQLGDDYRVDSAEIMLSVIRGAGADEIRSRVAQVEQARPEDKVEESRFHTEFARIFAMAGLVSDSIEMLEPLFAPPSEVSATRVDLDPAYNRIREDPEFIAMMERHR